MHGMIWEKVVSIWWMIQLLRALSMGSIRCIVKPSVRFLPIIKQKMSNRCKLSLWWIECCLWPQCIITRESEETHFTIATVHIYQYDFYCACFFFRILCSNSTFQLNIEYRVQLKYSHKNENAGSNISMALFEFCQVLTTFTILFV